MVTASNQNCICVHCRSSTIVTWCKSQQVHKELVYSITVKIQQCFFVKEYFPVWRHPVAIIVKTGMPPFGILANHKIKMCHNSMNKIMIQKITQNNWNFWTVNLIMRAKKLLTSRQLFRYAVPARTVTKKALRYSKYKFTIKWLKCIQSDFETVSLNSAHLYGTI